MNDNTCNSLQLSFYSKANITDVFGKDCTEHFLFLSINWNQPSKDAIESMHTYHNFNNSHPQHFQNITLDQCLQHFTKPEKLDEMNHQHCSDCNKHMCALKTIEL